MNPAYPRNSPKLEAASPAISHGKRRGKLWPPSPVRRISVAIRSRRTTGISGEPSAYANRLGQPNFERGYSPMDAGKHMQR